MKPHLGPIYVKVRVVCIGIKNVLNLMLVDQYILSEKKFAVMFKIQTGRAVKSYEYLW